MIAQLDGMAKVPDPTWARYVFDRSFADHRHSLCIFNSQRHSLLSSLFEVLTEEELRHIMTGEYDLGNGRSLPGELQTYAALERALGYQPNCGESGLRPLKKLVQELLGMPIKCYFDRDPSNTLKVLNLLHRYQRGKNRSLYCQKLHTFLKMPQPKRPSFEFSDDVVVHSAVTKQRIINELTVHLGSELGAECRNRVRSTFFDLAYHVGVAELALMQRAFAITNVDIEIFRSAFSRAMDVLTAHIESCSIRRPMHRLDLDLMIYLNRAKMVNRIQARAEIIDVIQQANLPLQSIESDIIRLNAIFDRERKGSNVNIGVVRPTDISAFLEQFSTALKNALGNAFGIEITDQQYEVVTEVAKKIIISDGAYVYETRSLSLTKVLAILCLSHVSVEHPASYRFKPYWHGQRNQSDRPLYYLNNQEPPHLVDISEGRIVFWRECTRQFTYKLLGQLPYWELANDITDRINEVMIKAMESHNLEIMQNFVTALHDISKEDLSNLDVEPQTA